MVGAAGIIAIRPRPYLDAPFTPGHGSVNIPVISVTNSVAKGYLPASSVDNAQVSTASYVSL